MREGTEGQRRARQGSNADKDEKSQGNQSTSQQPQEFNQCEDADNSEDDEKGADKCHGLASQYVIEHLIPHRIDAVVITVRDPIDPVAPCVALELLQGEFGES